MYNMHFPDYFADFGILSFEMDSSNRSLNYASNTD